MKRREFFRFSGASIAAVGAASFISTASAVNFPTSRSSRTALIESPPPASKKIDQAFWSVLGRMRSSGWAPILRQLAGFDLSAVTQASEGKLFEDLTFERSGVLKEFGGARAIQPSDPAMSLLYHVVAASEAYFPSLPSTAYLSDAEIDVIENYIYDRTALQDIEGLVPAVFAYEYRQAFKTPHLSHADMVFARAGVSRTGTVESVFNPILREFGSPPRSDSETQSCATIPARFGLFLAERRSVDQIGMIAQNSREKDHVFLLPICKLASGGRLLGGRGIQFQHSHRDEKLLRLMRSEGRPDDGFDWNAPPFLRKSFGEDGVDGARTLPEETYPLASIRALPGSARVFPEARPLTRLASQNARVARFPVKSATGGTFSNRRYTSLKLVEDRRAEGIDAFFSDFLFRGGRPTTGLRAARNVPSFVHIRAAVTGDDDIEFLSRSQESLPTINAGGYDAAMFEDGLCDGCVTARIIGTTDHEARELPEIVPAVSFVAAPDFFPRVDPLDLERFDKMFLEGGTESLSGLRLPANPLVELPGQPGKPAFPIEAPRPDIAETMTAAVSAGADEESSYEAKGYARSSALNTLTDTVSNVFFPGWDMTYSNAPELSDHRFMASFGLGSPFPEDMKLCAAANGMWAGASPDASRTFYGTLDALPLLGRPATAVPLLDSEIGYHPASPARTEWGLEPLHEFGWDGEYGPFIALEPTDDKDVQPMVDCTDILLSDYVRNALEKRMDLGRIQSLTNTELIRRMATLKACLKLLPRGGRAATTDMWLVSAEAVPEWLDGADGVGVPKALAPRSNGRIKAAPNLSGKGYLYLFAYCPSPGEGTRVKGERRRFAARRLYLCQGDSQRVRYARLDTSKEGQTKLRWSRPREVKYG